MTPLISVVLLPSLTKLQSESLLPFGSACVSHNISPFMSQFAFTPALGTFSAKGSVLPFVVLSCVCAKSKKCPNS